MSENNLLPALIRWANGRTDLRAMLQTGSRANPRGMVDRFSDYDLILVVADPLPYFNDRSWLSEFGEVLVSYWDPLEENADPAAQTVSCVIEFADHLHIDFSIWPVERIQTISRSGELPADMDEGWRVIVDKDRLTASLPRATGKALLPQQPTQAEFHQTVEDFFSDVPYVAKHLWRDELLPAKWCLDYDMRIFLLRMLTWQAAVHTSWDIPAGVHSRGLHRRLPPEAWRQFEDTWAGADIAANWQSLFRQMALMRASGQFVAKSLGLSYPLGMDQNVVNLARSIHQTPKT